MKKIYKSLLYTALNAVLVTGLLLTANAQPNKSSSGSGSNSGSRPAPVAPSGGGGGSRPSGGMVSSQRPPGGGGGSRPAGSMMGGRVGVAQNGANRLGGSMGGNRPAYGYSPRQGGVNGTQPGGFRTNFVSPQRQGVSISQNIASRGYVGTNPPRGGYVPSPGGATSYRNPGHGGGANYWGSHNYYYHNHGYYKTYYQPRLGFTCTVLPYGYYPFFWGDAQYYYSDGLFYNYDNDQYTVVEPPVGAEVTTLPKDAQSIVINGQQYYESAGVYYQPYTKDDGTLVYVVAGKDGELNTNTQDNQPAPLQIGDIVNQLPPNCRKILVSGQKLYVSPDGVYYQPMVDASNITTYKIVGLPSDQIDQN